MQRRHLVMCWIQAAGTTIMQKLASTMMRAAAATFQAAPTSGTATMDRLGSTTSGRHLAADSGYDESAILTSGVMRGL